MRLSECRTGTWDFHIPSAPPGTTGGAEGSCREVNWSAISQRLVSGDQRVQLGLDHLLQLPDSGKVGVLTFLLLTVKDLLTIQVNFQSAIRPRGERNPHIWPKGSKEFVRQPRGGRVELSRHAVQPTVENHPALRPAMEERPAHLRVPSPQASPAQAWTRMIVSQSVAC
jgi:hypothetical protein